MSDPMENRLSWLLCHMAALEMDLRTINSTEEGTQEAVDVRSVNSTEQGAHEVVEDQIEGALQIFARGSGATLCCAILGMVDNGHIH